MRNLHRTCFYVTLLTTAILTRATFNLKKEPCKIQTAAVTDEFSFEAGSHNRFHMIVCELRLNETEKAILYGKSAETGRSLVEVPLVTEAKMKEAARSSDFPGWHWTAWEGTAVLFRVRKEGRKVVMEPVSHEVLIVLGVTTVKLRIVKVVSHLCFQSTPRYHAFLLFLSFVLLKMKITK